MFFYCTLNFASETICGIFNSILKKDGLQHTSGILHRKAVMAIGSWLIIIPCACADEENLKTIQTLAKKVIIYLYNYWELAMFGGQTSARRRTAGSRCAPAKSNKTRNVIF
jgi:hypothetical protein